MFVHRGMFDAAATIVPEEDMQDYQQTFQRVGESIRLTEAR
jgi:hypothetical protein